jgi:hypothetical protein
MTEILFDNIDDVVAARLGRGGETQSGGCAALHRRLSIITSLARLKSCLTKNEIIGKINICIINDPFLIFHFPFSI